MKEYSLEDITYILNGAGSVVKYTQLSAYNEERGGIMVRLIGRNKSKRVDLFVSIPKEMADSLERIISKL